MTTEIEITALIERLGAGTFPIGEPDPLCGEAAAMLRDVAAERDEWRDRHKSLGNAALLQIGESAKLRGKAEAERDRLAAMVEKLRGYAVHDDDCGVNALLMPRLPLTKQCTCGLSDVLKESGRV